MSIQTGGPAFPATQEQGCNTGVSGMTLRDYFAATSLQGILASGDEYDDEGISTHAYALADAMLAERAKGQQ